MYHIQRPVDEWKRAVEILPDGALPDVAPGSGEDRGGAG